MIGSSNAPVSNIITTSHLKYGSLSNVATSGQKVIAYDNTDLSRYNYVIMSNLPNYSYKTNHIYIWVLNIKTNKIEIRIRDGYFYGNPSEFATTWANRDNLLYFDREPGSSDYGTVYVDVKDNKLIFSISSNTTQSGNLLYSERVPSQILFV